MQKVILILAALASLLMWSCSDNDHFKVEGTIEGAPTFNMRFNYYGDDVLRSGITASREGKFSFSASSRQPVMVEIYDNDYRLMGRFYASNGDEITCRLDRQNPYKSSFDGNEVNKRWTRFTNANADVLVRPGTEANRLIESFVAVNTNDIISSMLICGSYDASRNPLMADSLLNMLSHEARPENFTAGFELLLNRVSQREHLQKVLPMTFIDKNDSLQNFNPRHSGRSLIVISNNSSGRTDSIVPELKLLSRKFNKKELKIIDFSVDTDTTIWKQSIRRDSATWIQGWGAASISAPAVNKLAAPTVPFFIVADSTGKQIYRGVSISEAVKFIKN